MPVTSEFAGMKRMEGSVFLMGSDRFYPEERPARKVRVRPFWIDECAVTNAEFARFVDGTGYRTLAETPPDPADYPGLNPDLARAGSLVFERTTGPVPLNDPARWWRFCVGADWRHPTGPDSAIDAAMDHPVIHIAHADALAYAQWAGKSLPSEAEWEYAARGGLNGADYGWGDELDPQGRALANYWRGHFPYSNLREDGGYRTLPVRAFPANDYGLYDMIGNVWEWTDDWWDMRAAPSSPCCVMDNPRGGTLGSSFDPDAPHVRIGRKVIKGGSHLCAPSYCQRYRPAARSPQMIDSSTSHIGFRCVRREPQDI